MGLSLQRHRVPLHPLSDTECHLPSSLSSPIDENDASTKTTTTLAGFCRMHGTTPFSPPPPLLLFCSIGPDPRPYHCGGEFALPRCSYHCWLRITFTCFISHPLRIHVLFISVAAWFILYQPPFLHQVRWTRREDHWQLLPSFPLLGGGAPTIALLHPSCTHSGTIQTFKTQPCVSHVVLLIEGGGVLVTGGNKNTINV